MNINELRNSLIHNKEQLPLQDNDVAIIGMDFNIAGMDSVEKMHRCLQDGHDMIRELYGRRREDMDHISKVLLNNEYDKLLEMGYMDEIDLFDHNFFSYSHQEAVLMDPSHRLLLQSVYHAFEDAGVPSHKYQDSKTGVFIAYGNNDMAQYRHYVYSLEPDSAGSIIINNHRALLAGRISYHFNLHGPNMVIDTACSSSLTAVYTAYRSLLVDECEMAIVSGIQYSLLPIIDPKFNVGIQSKNGRTKTFNNDSDGTGIGEGYVTIVLKKMSKAIADRDPIHAVIKGIACNQDGLSSSLTSPNPKAQIQVISDALDKANIYPETIQYIEAHGTGTKIGDPLELSSLQYAYSKHTNKKHFCAIGSVKSNIGHLDSVAGLAGIIKCILSFKYKALYPTIHCQYPNKDFDFLNSAMYLSLQYRKWEKGETARRCAVSSFGISGTNSHMILEEPAGIADGQKRTDIPQPVCFSGQNENVLVNNIKAIKAYIDNHLEINFGSLCYTLNSRRDHHMCRLAIVADNVADLSHKISQVLSGADDADYVYTNTNLCGEHQPDSLTVSYYSAQHEKAIQFIHADHAAWQKAYEQGSQCISLPGYQFDKIRCWPDRAPEDTGFYANSLCKPVVWEKTGSMEKAKNPTNKKILFICADNTHCKKTVNILKSMNNEVRCTFWSHGYSESLDTTYDMVIILPPEAPKQYTATEIIANVKTFFYTPHIVLDTMLNNGLCAKAFYIITCHAYTIGSETYADPFSSAFVSYIHTYLHTKVGAARIHVADLDNLNEQMMQAISIEHGYEGTYIAFRKGSMYHRSLQNMNKMLPSLQKPYFRDRGTCVIIGGTGALGSALCEKLLDIYKELNLHVVGKRDASSAQAKNSLCVPEGSTIHFHTADITDEEQVIFLCNSISKKDKLIDGVVFCAGVRGNQVNGRPDLTDMQQTCLPKILGLHLIHKYLLHKNSFCIIYSSVAALGAFGKESDYASSNAFVDTYASKLSMEGIRAITVNWAGFNSIGLSKGLPGNNLALHEEEAYDSLFDALDCNLKQVFIGRLEPATDTESNHSQSVPIIEHASVQEKIIYAWGNILGHTRFTLDDDFYTVGGNSINAVGLSVKIKELTGYEIQMQDISTIRAIINQINSEKQLVPYSNDLYIDCFFASLFTLLSNVSIDIENFLLHYVPVYKLNKKDQLVTKYKSSEGMQIILERYGITSATFDTIEEILLFLSNSKRKDQHLILAVDCYYMENKEAYYLKKHLIHYIIVESVNQHSKQVSIIDQIEQDSLSYKTMQVSTDCLIRAYNEAKQAEDKEVMEDNLVLDFSKLNHHICTYEQYKELRGLWKGDIYKGLVIQADVIRKHLDEQYNNFSDEIMYQRLVDEFSQIIAAKKIEYVHEASRPDQSLLAKRSQEVYDAWVHIRVKYIKQYLTNTPDFHTVLKMVTDAIALEKEYYTVSYGEATE